MNDLLEIGLVKDKKLQDVNNFFVRKFEEQLASKKLTLVSHFVIIAAEFADFFVDIYDAFFFEIKQGDETHGYI